MLKKIRLYFSKPLHQAGLNALLIIIAIAANIYFQVFCIPTAWAMIALAICFLNIILNPITIYLKNIASLIGILNGLTFSLFIYCIIFLELLPLASALVFGILLGFGFIAFLPHYFAVQLVWNNIIKPKSPSLPMYFLFGIIISIAIVIYTGNEYSRAIASVQEFKNSNFEKLEKTFMIEKILGMHFIYHTRIDLYDGWRPPKHEPLMVIGMWLNNGYDPLSIDLQSRINLYQKFFPDNKIKFDCACAIQYRNAYHNSDRWIKLTGE